MAVHVAVFAENGDWPEAKENNGTRWVVLTDGAVLHLPENDAPEYLRRLARVASELADRIEGAS